MQSTIKLRFTRTTKYNSDDWFDRYRLISQDQQHHVLLESGRGGRFHIIGLSPSTVLEGKGNELKVQTSEGTTTQTGDLLDLVQNYLQTTEIVSEGTEELPDFKGGAIGYISYDVARQIERLPNETADDLDMPDVYFILFDEIIVLDKKTNRLTFIVHVEQGASEQGKVKVDELEKKWFGEIETLAEQIQSADEKGKQFQPYSMGETAFIGAVEQIQEYIRNGDVFQVNLSVRQSQKHKTEPIDIYKHLREFNPSPYMGYFHTPEFQLVNGSPELLVKKKGNLASTRPIAGTRSRGRDEREDEELAKTLIENEKERAEHVMLVDLERNDLGRVCQYGTVEVNEFMVIEKYSHVMHIVSNVQGTLQNNQNAMDVIRATFPGGTITGAPKVRTMEIIEEMEPVRRGVYTGSIGWIGFEGDMEMNIAIRTMVCKDGWAHVQAGAGIVIDSNPEAEYKESLKKAKALWYAKELSEQAEEEVIER
ncbi:aminodeoxychorismate synthase, component I [Alkalihalobacillus sp. AL-G]|uniref:aminodeoxychorismate synthase, component I n=1 Tax=Alkalihalobacillus sp. AL-G TaxID=2926399 RepID=UPI00272A7216|nr:aminodeoxychorismate synthase, component I [Alkalihalobacillus sp. AL-G]WLD93485.1 aminodeoxychorismate synthase, component I [Alkalihalobacillus sp. AL-G]